MEPSGAVTTGAFGPVLDSYAPMSQLGSPCGRTRPRWSRLKTGVALHTAALPAPSAVEPASNAKVLFGPPLSASGPRLGSPLREAEQLPSSTRLLRLVPIVL